MFPKQPICEECGAHEAVSFSLVRTPDGTNKWMFTCYCTANREVYYMEFDRFFPSPAATIDWLAELREKTWMDPDDFFSMMWRFRKATGSSELYP